MTSVLVVLFCSLLLQRSVSGWTKPFALVRSRASTPCAASVSESSTLQIATSPSSAAEIKKSLLKFSLQSNRGEIATDSENERIKNMVEQLEVMNPTPAPAVSELCLGEWDLIYSDTQLFRSSPFFLSARAVCRDGEEADRFDLFCGLHRAALAFTSIGHVKQIITRDFLRNEFEATGALLPGLPTVVKGTIMSTASIESATDNSWNLRLESARIKPGTSNVPFLKSILDNSEGVPVQQLAKVLENTFDRYETPTPSFRTMYLDDDFRVSRDQDDHLFIYIRSEQ